MIKSLGRRQKLSKGSFYGLFQSSYIPLQRRMGLIRAYHALCLAFALGRKKEMAVTDLVSQEKIFLVRHTGGEAVIYYISMLPLAQHREGDAATVG